MPEQAGQRGPLLSVIVPMYNVEAYIVDCLESLNGQLGDEELEIVVVDDAATDGSASRVADFVERFPTAPIKVVRHDVNRGLGEARRTGFGACTGVYVWCLDADDLAAPDSLAVLMNELQDLPDDAILQFRDYELVDSAGNRTGRRRSGIRAGVRELSANEYLRQFLRGEASPNITNKVFRRECVEVDDLSSRRIWEDNPTLIALMNRFRRVRVTDLIVYQIRERATSIMRSGTQLEAHRTELVAEVALQIQTRFGDVFDIELPYYLLNAGVMEDILTALAREATFLSAWRRVRILAGDIEWSAIRRAVGLRKPRTVLLAAAVRISPLLATVTLRSLLLVGPWRR